MFAIIAGWLIAKAIVERDDSGSTTISVGGPEAAATTVPDTSAAAAAAAAEAAAQAAAAKACIVNAFRGDANVRADATAAWTSYDNRVVTVGGFDGWTDLANELGQISLYGCSDAFTRGWAGYVSAWSAFGDYVENHSGAMNVFSRADEADIGSLRTSLVGSFEHLAEVARADAPDAAVPEFTSP